MPAFVVLGMRRWIYYLTPIGEVGIPGGAVCVVCLQRFALVRWPLSGEDVLSLGRRPVASAFLTSFKAEALLFPEQLNSRIASLLESFVPHVSFVLFARGCAVLDFLRYGPPCFRAELSLVDRMLLQVKSGNTTRYDVLGIAMKRNLATSAVK